MKRILILGAGRTVPSLIKYLAGLQSEGELQIRVGDISGDLAQQRAATFTNVEGFSFDVNRQEQLDSEIAAADLIISLLPVVFHLAVAKVCLRFKKPLLTASYVSTEMAELHKEAILNGVLLLNECGLDPGLDHMTAKSALDHIRLKLGGSVFSFKSYTGGLVAPESDNNPWGYKFTWNPRNVVLAGSEPAKFLRNGRYKYIPYHRVFTRLDPIEVEGYGEFEGYPNRDSLKYRDLYELQDVQTMLRGTLRRPGFCRAWNLLVQLGLTDDSYLLEYLNDMTYRDYINTFLYYHPSKQVEDKICDYLNLSIDGPEMNQLRWLGIFERCPIGLSTGSPAKVLQHLLEEKWQLEAGDRDMIVMQHQVGYAKDGEVRQHVTSMVVVGDDNTHTAMSKTVSWPLGIAAWLVLTGKIKSKGVVVPVDATFYQPIIKELSSLGVHIIEKDFHSTDSNP